MLCIALALAKGVCEQVNIIDVLELVDKPVLDTGDNIVQVRVLSSIISIYFLCLISSIGRA